MKFVMVSLLFVLIVAIFNVSVVHAVVTGKMGEVLEDSRMVFYVVNYTETSGAIGMWTPKQGDKFVIVEIVIKNKLAEPLSYSALFAKLKDEQNYEYTSSVATSGLDYSFTGNKIAPKDIVRGQIAFEVPSNATGFNIEYADFLSSFAVELVPSSSPKPIPTSEYAPQYGVGDTVQNGRVALTLNSYEEKSWIGIYQAKEGWIFLITDITIKNIGSENISYNVLYISVKDSNGYMFSSHIATSSLTDGLSSGTLTPGESVRGKVAFQVPASETYFVIHYNDLYSFLAAPAIPEFPNAFLLPLLIIVTLFTAAVLRRAQKCEQRENETS
ncbi:MAG: DUF4352 domain-containing protein [Candidatus Bathyarchaeales archaeon]